MEEKKTWTKINPTNSSSWKSLKFPFNPVYSSEFSPSDYSPHPQLELMEKVWNKYPSFLVFSFQTFFPILEAHSVTRKLFLAASSKLHKTNKTKRIRSPSLFTSLTLLEVKLITCSVARIHESAFFFFNSDP